MRGSAADRGQGVGAGHEGGEGAGDAGVAFAAVEARDVGRSDEGLHALRGAEEGDEGEDPQRTGYQEQHQEGNRLDAQRQGGADAKRHAVPEQAEQDPA